MSFVFTNMGAPIRLLNLDSTTVNENHSSTTNTVNNIHNTDITHTHDHDILEGTLIEGSRFTHMGNFNEGFQEFRLQNLAAFTALPQPRDRQALQNLAGITGLPEPNPMFTRDRQAFRDYYIPQSVPQAALLII